MTIGKPLQAFRQVIRLGHRRAVDQDGNDTNPAVERRLDFNSHKITRIFETPLVVLISGGNPILSDDGYERLAFADPLDQNVDEIEACLDIVDVYKDILGSKLLPQALVNEPRESGGIVSPIADKDA